MRKNTRIDSQMGLADEVLAGDIQAAARLMRGLEDEVPQAIEESIETIESFVRNYAYQETGEGGYLEKLIDDLAQRKTSPPSAALEIINRFTKQFKSAIV